MGMLFARKAQKMSQDPNSAPGGSTRMKTQTEIHPRFLVRNSLFTERERVLDSVKDVLDKRADISLYGPITAQTQVGREIIKSIQDFRREQYEARSPWMLVPAILDLEERLNIDERSFHFLAADGDTILSCLRLSSEPFEFSELNPELRRATRIFENFFEVSRFLTRKNSSTGTARALLYKAAHWVLTESDKDGLFGICRPVGRKYFQRYGTKVFDGRAFDIPHRPNVGYSLMWINGTMMYDHFVRSLDKLSVQIA
jgi:hypothetical protein